jgi:hypothetical protein
MSPLFALGIRGERYGKQRLLIGIPYGKSQEFPYPLGENE